MDTNESYNTPEYSQTPQSENMNSTRPQPKMKWYNFLIYFSLFFSAVINLGSGIMQITGLNYNISGGDASTVYLYYGAGLKIIDVLFGIFVIVLAVYAVYVRFRLAHFKKNGPMSYYMLLAANAIGSTIYYIVVSFVTGIMMLDSSTITTLISSIVMLALNVVYFNKRIHLFVN